MKTQKLILLCIVFLTAIESKAQFNIYRSGGGEIILSGANTTNVSTNARFTLFFHTQQMLNIDFASFAGIYAGAAIRNVGLIMEDQYQFLGFTDIPADLIDKNAKVKRRSYSLGFPLALKLGSLGKHLFVYAGGEYEWMFHYKQKLFLDGQKTGKQKAWGSDRVNAWNPSVFAGVQFPGGFNLKFKYYLKDFLNHSYVGEDFGRPVDYSQFTSTGIWYISLAVVINKNQLKKMLDPQNRPSLSASKY